MKIGIIGQGGHSKVIKDIILANQKFEIMGCFDDKYEAEVFHDGIYYGPIDSVPTIAEVFNEVKFIIAVGNNKVRKLIVERLNLSEERYALAVHPSAIISPSARIGWGTVVMPYTVINAHAIIGDHVIINTCSVIEHDNKIGPFVHVSPNATLTGGVHIEEGTQIGAGATIIPNIKIGEWAIIGAGATVINNISAHCTAVGTPARVKINEFIGGG